MTPYRDRAYLDLAAGQPCISCGAPCCVSAHYSGLMAHKVGKGGAQKSSDVVSAHLCAECHLTADSYAGGNDDARAADFLLNCWRTLLRNIDAGLVSLTVHASPIQRVQPRERVAGRRRKSACLPSPKTFPRGDRLV